MRTTIGELTNELMFYSRMVEMSMVGDTPFIKALLGSKSGFTKAYVYIVQIAEHRYSVCDHYDELHGKKYLPTRSIHQPFVTEKEFINRWLKSIKQEEEGNEENNYITLGLNYSDFLDHLYNLLFQYQIISVNPKIFDNNITNLKFSSRKVSKNIESVFKQYRFNSPRIRDLITIVKKTSGTFNLGNLKSKDINELRLKLKQVGIILNIQNSVILDLQFEKKEELRRIKYSS